MAEIKYIKWASLQPKIEKWEFISIELDDSRVYYKDRGDGLGLEFKQIKPVAYREAWLDPTDDYEILLHGSGSFDGIRHLYFGSEESSNEGYFYYPSIRDIHAALDVIRALEVKYCRDYE